MMDYDYVGLGHAADMLFVRLNQLTGNNACN